MNCERNIRFELLARLCPNTTGADIRSVCIEAGMFAIRSRRKTVTEKDMIDAVNKCAHLPRRAPPPIDARSLGPDPPRGARRVIKGYSKFSATPKYLVYN